MAGIPVRRLRPSPAALAALVGLLWAGSAGAVREFVWADLRDGVIRVGDLPRSTRSLARVGFVLLFGMVLLLLAGDVLRGASELLPLSSGTATRGAQVPVALVPITLFMFSVAWAFLLAGAARAHIAIALGVCLVYLAAVASWVGSATHLAQREEAVAAWILVGLVPTLVLLLRRMRERPLLEFLGLLTLVGGAVGIGLLLGFRTLQATGIPLSVVSLDLLLAFLRGLVTPLLILIGLDIADFALRLSRWSTDLVEDRLPGWAVPAALAGVLGWQAYRLGSAFVDDPGTASGYVGAFAVPAIVLGCVWAIARLARQGPSGADAHPDAEDGSISTQGASGDADDDPTTGVVEGTATYALPITLGYLGWQITLTLVLIVLTAFVAVVDLPATTIASVERVLAVVGDLTTRAEIWQLGFWVAALAIAVLLVRRSRPTLAVYFAVLGATGLWRDLVAEGRPFAPLGWSEGQVELAWLLVVVAIAVREIVSDRFHGARRAALLLVAVVLSLLGAADFIGDPFSPVFAFAGVAFVAFGVVWDALTSGSWTNVGTPRLPRTSRIFLYLGYVLFSVTLIVWAVVSHDLAGVDHFTGGAAMDGFAVFGRPLVYAVVASLLLRVSLRPAETLRHRDDEGLAT